MKTKAKKKWDFQMRGERRAEVLLYGDIGDVYYGGTSAKAFVEGLQALGDIDELDVRINSRGGSITEGFAIYETLRQHKAKKNAYIDGLAGSIASIFPIACDTVAIAESGFIMIHRGWNACVGDADEFRRTASVLEMMEVKLIDAYMKRAEGVDRIELFNMMRAETWMDADRSVELGFADEIVKPETAAAMAFDLSIFKNPPPVLKAQDLGPVSPVAALKALQDAADEVAVRLRLLDVDDATL